MIEFGAVWCFLSSDIHVSGRKDIERFLQLHPEITHRRDIIKTKVFNERHSTLTRSENRINNIREIKEIFQTDND